MPPPPQKKKKKKKKFELALKKTYAGFFKIIYKNVNKNCLENYHLLVSDVMQPGGRHPRRQQVNNEGPYSEVGDSRFLRNVFNGAPHSNLQNQNR